MGGQVFHDPHPAISTRQLLTELAGYALVASFCTSCTVLGLDKLIENVKIPTPPRFRFRFRFGLRSLFVLVTVVAIACGWVTYSLNWIRQRNDLLTYHYDGYPTFYGTDGSVFRPVAPSWLWLYGEPGVAVIVRHTKDPEEKRWLQRVFPEARIEDEAPY